MRIITGSARGTKLMTLAGDDVTRPTAEMVKEAIFSMIQFDIVFLDPPYASNFISDAIEQLCNADALASGAVIVCESNNPSPYSPEGFTVRRFTRYSKTYVTLLEKESGEEVV